MTIETSAPPYVSPVSSFVANTCPFHADVGETTGAKLSRQCPRQRRVNEVLVERRESPLHQIPIDGVPGDRAPIDVPQHEPSAGAQHTVHLVQRGRDVIDILDHCTETARSTL